MLALRAPLLLLPLVLASVLPAQDPPTLPSFERRTPVVLAVENVGPAVVNLRILGRASPYSGFGFRRPVRPTRPEEEGLPADLEDRSVGSGVIIHPDGYVVTNDHVIRRAELALAYLSDGRRVEARVISTSPDADIAILKLEASGPFPFAVLGNSEKTMVGETTIAIGNPFGLSSSVTSGILSAKERPVPVGEHNETRTVMQTSALINPGNSGGPLCDINGRVIGINVAIDRRGPGIGYAIPIDRVKEVAAELLAPEVSRSLTTGLEVLADAGGLLVEHVREDSPAEKAGFSEGQRVVRVGDHPVRNVLDYHLALQGFAEGDPVPLSILSDEGMVARTVRLAPLPIEELLGDALVIEGLACRNLSDAAMERLGIAVPDARFHGVLITEVADDSSAARIGVRPGDVLYQFGNYGVGDVRRLKVVADHYLARQRRGGRLPIHVFRPGQGAMKGSLSILPKATERSGG